MNRVRGGLGLTSQTITPESTVSTSTGTWASVAGYKPIEAAFTNRSVPTGTRYIPSQTVDVAAAGGSVADEIGELHTPIWAAIDNRESACAGRCELNRHGPGRAASIQNHAIESANGADGRHRFEKSFAVGGDVGILPPFIGFRWHRRPLPGDSWLSFFKLIARSGNCVNA